MKKISFIGVGNMAAAIIRAMTGTQNGISGSDIILFNRTPAKYAAFADLSPVIAASAAEAVSLGDVIFLAVKPQNFSEVLGSIRESEVSLDGKVFVSIAAGISTSAISAMLGREVAVVRCMPNTPLQIGLGVTAVSRNTLVSDADFAFVCDIFGCAGMVMKLDEAQMNTVICANGSSPAYVYFFIDAMVKSARAQGLGCDNLVEAVCKSVIGSAQLLMDSGKSPEELIRAVTSPKGTTERAMNVLYENGVDKTIDKAMRACSDRAEEMSRCYSGINS